MTDATIGHGSAFAIGDGETPEVFTDIPEVRTITPPAFSRGTVDATHMGSPDKWREFAAGLRDAGEADVTFNFAPGGAAQDAVIDKFVVDTVSNYRITFPTLTPDELGAGGGDVMGAGGTATLGAGGGDNVIWTFSALCVAFASAVPLDGVMTAAARFRLTGRPAFAPIVPLPFILQEDGSYILLEDGGRIGMELTVGG